MQYSLDRWLRDTTVDVNPANKQFEQRATPADPQNCPDHRTVQKSFLNQICEDCLLAELEAEPSLLDKRGIIHHSPITNSDSGEGLVWDSEVKIEIEGQTPVSPTSSMVSEAPKYINNCPGEDDKRIFDSHVEITIEVDGHSVSAEELSSPIFTASQTSGRSRSSSVATSPPSRRHTDLCPSGSCAYRDKRYGRAFRNRISDFDDADDEFDHQATELPRTLPPVLQGRSLTRSNLHNVLRCEPDAGKTQQAVSTKNVGKAVSRFQGLRSLSTRFLSVPKSTSQNSRIEQNVLMETTNSSAPSRSRSKNPFRSIRGRKISPPGEETSAPTSTCSSEHDSNTDITSFEARKMRPVPPRKSSLKELALFLVQDLKRTRAKQSRSDSQPISKVLSLTSLWGGIHVDNQEWTNSDTQKSGSHPDTVFETGSGVSSLESEGTLRTETDEEPWASGMIASIPKSSTMNTLRAVINDLDLGVDNQETRAMQSWVSKEDKIGNRERPAAVGPGKTCMLEGNTKYAIYPPRSTSLKSPAGVADASPSVPKRDVTETRLNANFD